MKAKILVYALLALILTTIHLAEAQQPAKIPRIGYLRDSIRCCELRIVRSISQGLRELGYIEGKNIVIEYRYADGKAERFPSLRRNWFVLRLTSSLPVRRASSRGKESDQNDPHRDDELRRSGRAGLVASLARPGGNVTGLTSLDSELSGKRLELLKEVVPKVTRFAVSSMTIRPAPRTNSFKDAGELAQALGVKLQPIEVKLPIQISTAHFGCWPKSASALS